MWVICGSHSNCYVGQMGQKVRPAFNPSAVQPFLFVATIATHQ